MEKGHKGASIVFHIIYNLGAVPVALLPRAPEVAVPPPEAQELRARAIDGEGYSWGAFAAVSAEPLQGWAQVVKKRYGVDVEAFKWHRRRRWRQLR